MKKLGKKAVILLCAAVAMFLAAVGIFITNRVRARDSIIYTNYMACSYLDIGQYARCRTEAQRALELRENRISKDLIVLSCCYEQDYASAGYYCNLYRAGADTVQQELEAYIANAVNGSADVAERYKIYMEIKGKIKISDKKLKQVQAARDILVMKSGTYSYDELDEKMELLKKKKDAVCLQALAYGSCLLGDGEKVIQYTAKIAESKNTTANVAAAANAVAAHYSQTDSYSKDSEINALNQKIMDASNEISNLQQKLNEAYTKGRNTESISRRIDKKNYEIQEIHQEIISIPYDRAINFISSRQPVFGRETGIDLELARLYYMKGGEEKAEEILMEVFTRVMGGDAGQYLEPELQRLLKAGSGGIYNSWTGEGAEDEPASAMTIYEAAEFVDYGLTLGLVPENESYDFANFLAETAQKYKSIINITHIDARNFPVIKVGFSTGFDDKLVKSLGKKDFEVLEKGVRITNFELKKGRETEENKEGRLSVCFVLDVSGSMEGEPLVNAKRAAGNFLSYLDDGTEAGLVAFESSARTVAALTESSGMVSKGLDLLYAGGGTSIAQGLSEGIAVLEPASGSPVIVLLSDGEDGDADMIDSVINTLVDKGIIVYSIGVGYADENYLRKISEATGGNHIQVQDAALLGSVYKTVSQYIVNEFEIQFEVVADRNDFNRNVKLIYDGKAFDERDYHVGVSAEQVLEEENLTILTDFYQQRGGSLRGGNGYEYK